MKPIAIFRHAPTEGPGYFATVLDRLALPWQLFALDEGVPVPHRAADFRGIACMGGPMSVNDPLPWIDPLCALLRDAVAHAVPVIGHCLGGQLLSKALGGTVGKNPVKEIGWHPIFRLPAVSAAQAAAQHQWLGPLERFLGFHWHGETFSLPTGAIPLLASTACHCQAFALGPHLGMQCHVEMTREMVENWCASGAGEIAEAGTLASVQTPATILTDLPTRLTALHGVADQLYQHWLKGLTLA